MVKNRNDFINWASCKILTDFIASGGPGLRSAIWSVVETFYRWQEELKNKEIEQ